MGRDYRWYFQLALYERALHLRLSQEGQDRGESDQDLLLRHAEEDKYELNYLGNAQKWFYFLSEVRLIFSMLSNGFLMHALIYGAAGVTTLGQRGGTLGLLAVQKFEKIWGILPGGDYL